MDVQQQKQLQIIINSLNCMLYWTSWPDNLDAVAVHREADSWLFTRLVSRIKHAT